MARNGATDTEGRGVERLIDTIVTALPEKELRLGRRVCQLKRIVLSCASVVQVQAA